MYDLHSHLLPGLDDGADSLQTALEMARLYAEQGVHCVACTPHIMPGLFHNTAGGIREAVQVLSARLGEAGIPLDLVTGADNHIVPDFAQRLKRGQLLTLANSSYVLVEPPSHAAPIHLEKLLFSIAVEGYVPVLTHPERLRWLETKYSLVKTLVSRGAWIQITSGSLTGRFGSSAIYWAERMLGDGLVHIIATDAHNMSSRPPDLLMGVRRAEILSGAEEAHHMVVTRPKGALMNVSPKSLPSLQSQIAGQEPGEYGRPLSVSNPHVSGSFAMRVRRLLG
jgi:protein-tyrosine phosphatase